MEELVFKSAKGNPVTTSLLVAEKFGKEHKNVIAAIKVIIQSAENSAHFYYSTTYKDSRNRHQEMFIMNRDGFSFLVLDYTCPKAGQWKEKFIFSRQMAEATEKRHTNVIRNIQGLIEKGAIDLIINQSSNLSPDIQNEPIYVLKLFIRQEQENLIPNIFLMNLQRMYL
jgi:Rha family phage regulatory protein